MGLNGAQFEQLVNALVAAFPSRADFEQLAQFKLGVNLDAIVGGGSLQATAFGLVRWAQAQGRLDDLLAGALSSNPGSAQLRALGASPATARSGQVRLTEPPAADDIEATLSVRLSEVPTAIYDMLEGEEALLTCRVVNRRATPLRALFTAVIEGYSDEARSLRRVTPGDTFEFKGLPALQTASVQTLNDIRDATLRVQVTDADSGRPIVDETHRIRLLPRTTMPLAMRDPTTGQWRDTLPYLAAFVTPNDPLVQLFVRKAVARTPSGAFVGYQSDVGPQVQALFDTLKARGFSYVNTLKASANQAETSVQRIRPVWESLENLQGNCIDGCVLFASLLEAISLNSALVLIPQHAMVAWQTDTRTDTWSYLETTAIRDKGFADACAEAESRVDAFRRIAGGDPMLFRVCSIADARRRDIRAMDRVVNDPGSRAPGAGTDVPLDWPAEVIEASRKLSDTDSARRQEGLAALRVMHRVDPLVQALYNLYPDVRCGAAVALAELGAAQAAPVLAGCVKEADGPPRADLLRALETLGKAAVPPLIALLDGEPAPLDVIAALGRLHDRSATTRLILLLQAASADVVAAAADALGRLGDPRAIDPLNQLLDDARPTSRAQGPLHHACDWAAAAIVAILGSSSAEPHLAPYRAAHAACPDATAGASASRINPARSSES